MTAAQVADGPMTAAGFRGHVAAALGPTPRPGGAVGLGDLPCPTSAAARAAVEAAGGRRVYLPPHGPVPSPVGLARARLAGGQARRARSVPAVVAFRGPGGRALRPAECPADIRHGGYGQSPAADPPNQR